MSKITLELIAKAIKETREYGHTSCIETEEGALVRIYDDVCGKLFGSYVIEDGEWMLASWWKSGRIVAGTHDKNLVPAKRSGEVWMNIYQDRFHYCYKSKQSADNHADKSRIACKRVKWTEGDEE